MLQNGLQCTATNCSMTLTISGLTPYFTYTVKTWHHATSSTSGEFLVRWNSGPVTLLSQSSGASGVVPTTYTTTVTADSTGGLTFDLYTIWASNSVTFNQFEIFQGNAFFVGGWWWWWCKTTFPFFLLLIINNNNKKKMITLYRFFFFFLKNNHFQMFGHVVLLVMQLLN